LAATCEATTADGTVTVTAQGTYFVGYEDPSLDCPAICIEHLATCTADGVAKGDFSLSYADATVDFTGPVTEAHCTGP